jgi:tRNA(adenine34) deaminase
MFTSRDEYGMQQAILLAERARQAGEVPVGAVLMLNDKVIAEGYNSPISQCDPTAHAEIIALRNASKSIHNYRLLNTTLYVTLEPCIMCAGAMVHARIKRLVYGATDPRAGAIVSRAQVLDQSFLNHRIEYAGGLLATECGELLTQFFRERR